MPPAPDPTDRLAAVRARFAARLVEERAALADETLGREETIALVHRMAGLAGTLGAHEVSARAKACELALLAGEDDGEARAGLIAAIDAYVAG